MKILCHICCGPCATIPLQDLQNGGHELSGLYYNPNIHPYTEYQRRYEGAAALTAHLSLSMLAPRPYDPTPYLQAIAFRESNRCMFCYRLRLEEAARIARKGKFEAFTSTLLVSPYQKHEVIRQMGEECAERYGVSFYYKDWRPFYADTIKISKELGLYRQPYCGCLYSEWERYAGSKPADGKARKTGSATEDEQ